MNNSVSIGTPVVFFCQETGKCHPALVTKVYDKPDHLEQPCVCLIAFYPQPIVQGNIYYVANDENSDTDSWHFVGDDSES